MNIRCPHCQTLFRVDPARVPARGIRARCARCGGTFQIAGTTAPDAPAAAVGRPGAGAPGAGPQPSGLRDAAPAAAGGPARPPTPEGARHPFPERPAHGAAGRAAAGPAADARPAAGQVADQPEGAAPGSAGAPPRPVFGSRDPSARAQRIARALVSDIVAYHPDRRDAALDAGTLRAEFRDEIMKSWDEYVAQVGQETAKSTPFFRQALNDILARGQAVF